MANKYLIGSAVIAAVIFSGCASKEATTAEAPKVTAPVAKDAGGASSTMGAGALGTAIEQAQGKLQTVLFDYDKYNIRADMQAIVDTNAKVSGDNAISSAKIKLEGNADERGTDEYNYALALKRANAVKTGYEAKGIKGDRISTVSLGEGNPVCKDSNEACWGKNRRVDTKLEK